MDFIDPSCFCSFLGEPFHWTWRTPGGGKMGVPWDTFTMAAFHGKQWVLALASPVRSIQGLPSLEITGVNLHKVFSGKDTLSVASASHGNASWLLQPDLSFPWGKLWMLSSGQLWCLLVVKHILTEFMVTVAAWWPPSPVEPWPAAVCLASWTMDHDTFSGRIQLRL